MCASFPRLSFISQFLFKTVEGGLLTCDFLYLLVDALDSKKKLKKLKKEIKENSADRIRDALDEFLQPILKDCEYFVYNQRTFGNESFHGLCNRYYEKGSACSFDLFVMKRQFAFLDWNEQMRKKALGQEDSELQDWQKKLLNLLHDTLIG